MSKEKCRGEAQGAVKILAISIMLALLWSDEARAESSESFWPMRDSGAADYSLKNRWGDPIHWCGGLVISELAGLMAAVERVVVTDRAITLLADDGTATLTREVLVGPIPATNEEPLRATNEEPIPATNEEPLRSYGFWRLRPGRTLVIAIACDAPTVCTMTASLIVRDRARAPPRNQRRDCHERWGTVAYRGNKPAAATQAAGR